MLQTMPHHRMWNIALNHLVQTAFSVSQTAWRLTKNEDPDGDWDDREIVDAGDAPWNWTFGAYKSPQRWANQMASRGWNKAQITRTIAQGKEFPAPNKVHPGNPAIRYELDGRFVVRDEVTKEILQISDVDFKPNR